MKRPGRAKPTPAPANARSHWRLSRWNGVFLLAGIAFTALAFHLWAPVPAFSRATEESPLVIVTNGPWGELEITPIQLERPDDYGAMEAPLPATITWTVKGRAVSEVKNFFSTAGLTQEQLQQLFNPANWVVGTNGISITPPMDLVRDMAPEPRERIYRMLAKYPENGMQRYPHYCRGKTFDEWFQGSGLAPETLALIQRMIYTRKGVLCFADTHYLQLTLSPDEMRQTSRILSRVPAQLLKLHVKPETDIAALLNYWGASSRAGVVKPLLESVKRLPEGGTLNVTWLFPPVPRLLAYTYPNPTNTINGRSPDCVWTAMNFSLETPDDSFAEGPRCGDVLKRDYDPIPKASRFGDLILLYEPDGADLVTVHMCIYIAHNIVFTKNGYDPRQPWVLMHIDDMMIKYLAEKPLKLAVFRKKAL